jgi:hypothetical protein
VLEQDDVDVRAPDQAGCALVVLADRLPDRGRDLGTPRVPRLVDDGGDLNVVDLRDADEAGAKIGRERGDPAPPRRIRGDDDGARGCDVAVMQDPTSG